MSEYNLERILIPLSSASQERWLPRPAAVGDWLPEQARASRFLSPEGGEVRPFELQQAFFFTDSSGIAGETSAGADDPVAGDQDRNGIVSNSAAHGLGRHGGLPQACRQLPRDASVGAEFSMGDLQKNVPYRFLKRGAGRIKDKVQSGGLSGKIAVQPAAQRGKDDVTGLFVPILRPRGIIFLPDKPESGDGLVVCRGGCRTQGGIKSA